MVQEIHSQAAGNGKLKKDEATNATGEKFSGKIKIC